MTKVHSYWKYTLNWMSTTEASLAYPDLRGQTLGPFGEDSTDLAIKFEQVLADWLPEKLYLRRDQLCGGKSEAGNGFTMWRRLHKDHVGDGEILEYAGTTVLREYGQCKKLSDVSTHIDGWYELLDLYGGELENAHKITRGMFLDIIPTELRTEILKEPKLNLAGHRALSSWCRSRVMVLTQEKLADLKKKELTTRARRGINSLLPGEETNEAGDVVVTTTASSNDLGAKLDKLIALQMNAMTKPPTKAGDRPARKDKDRPRSRSPSQGRRKENLIDWPAGKCFHCGGDHSREKCEKFSKMMRDANVGKPKDQWKPPEGYKSAIGKARDAARALLGPKPKAKAKSGAKRRVNSVVENDEDDTASESDFSDGDGNRPNYALRRFRKVSRGLPASQALMHHTPVKSICSLNQFEGLDTLQAYDSEVLASLNSWAHKVRLKPTREKRVKTNVDADLDKATKFVLSSQQPHRDTVIVRSLKDADRVSEVIKPLPHDRKTMTNILHKVSRVELAADERLVMVDSGSFCHAIDAQEQLPGHEVTPLSTSENSQEAESACGGIMKRLGRVRTRGLVEGMQLDIRWNSMKVKVPILSVRKLVQDNHNVWFEKHGGYILNLLTNEKLPFFEFQGVYYLKMKILPPPDSCSHHSVDKSPFVRQVA